MVEPDLAREVLRLLAAGVSGRGIGRRLAVSHQSILRIAHGTWAGFSRYPAELLASDPDSSLDPRPSPLTMSRCPDCGHNVELPCRICIARKALTKAQARGRRNGEPKTEKISLDLHGKDQERYQALRRRKLAAGEAAVTQVSPAEPVYEAPEEFDGDEVLGDEDLATVFGDE